MSSNSPKVLIVDDNEAIHNDFRRILGRNSESTESLDELERMLGGAPIPTAANGPTFELVSAHQGEEAVKLVSAARIEDRPYSVAFVDIRMPPGIDGIETIARMWACQPELEVVLCSAYSDYSWEDISNRLRPGDRLVVLRKPFDPIEVRQLAACLSEKWARGRALDDQLHNLQATVAREVEARLKERERHEEEQRRMRRLEALGRLAAGLAHEINTPTQFAASNLECLAELCGSVAEALAAQRAIIGKLAAGEIRGGDACTAADALGYAELVDEIPRAIADSRTGLSRISRIVHSVRSHAHLRDRECLAPLDINDQIKAALELARNEYKYDADVVTELGAIPLVLGDPGDLCLAILNLVVNASHAIRDKRTGHGPRGTIKVSTRCEGDRVEIAVADSGNGIPPEVRDRVFEPFFTTKPLGQGTGQGLAICRATIVERHRGTLRFDTEVGKGTVFTIGLPIATDAATSSRMRRVSGEVAAR
jgi:two-component system NtrC family sensor kinase